jgi:ribosome-binding protein aMBF1 (putative translation factor)
MRNKTINKEELAKQIAIIHEDLKPYNIRKKVKDEQMQRQQELLSNSYSFEDLAKKYGISTRRLKEYNSGKKIPRIGKAKTAFGFVCENYEYNEEVKRWFPIKS